MDDVAKETKVRYCTEYDSVNAEATWAESGYNTLGGLIYILVLHQKSAEAIVGKKRAISLREGKDGSLTDKLKG